MRKFSPPAAARAPLRLVIFGVQGSGKGTQAKLIAQRFGVVHVASGDLFRREVARGTPLGRRVRRYLKLGRLTPDAVTIIANALRQPAVRQRGFILDGFPRTIQQLRMLQRLGAVTAAIALELPDADAIRRIAGRRSCSCGQVYHLVYRPPRRAGVCDRCGRRLFIRADDRPAVIGRRVRTYHRATASLLAYYRRLDRLIAVDGRPPIPQVFANIVFALTRLRPSAVPLGRRRRA